MWTKIELKNGQYVNVPEPNRPVLAIPAVIKYVKADDHSWETVDDNSELSYSLDVIKWMYIPE